MSTPYTFDNEAFTGLIFYGTLALAKTSLMSVWTAYHRKKCQSFPSVEDVKIIQPGQPEKHKAMLQPNEQVERVRRAHLNDLENIIPFVVLGILYVGTNPPPVIALWHFRIMLAGRVLHSIVYVNGIRQPFRTI